MISKRLTECLPAYAIPVFMRICNQVEKTGTFKMKKFSLQIDGYNLERCAGNQLFIWDNMPKLYIPLTKEIQSAIDSGQYTGIQNFHKSATDKFTVPHKFKKELFTDDFEFYMKLDRWIKPLLGYFAQKFNHQSVCAS